jgi:hypothetical protein
MLYVLAVLVILAGCLWCAAFSPGKVGTWRRRRWLMRASVAELAAACADSARYMGFAEWHAGKSICAVREWTERDLLSVLEALSEEATRSDPPGVSGHGSNVYMYYDGGFAEIAELLRDRLGIPQPWAGRRPTGAATPRR